MLKKINSRKLLFLIFLLFISACTSYKNEAPKDIISPNPSISEQSELKDLQGTNIIKQIEPMLVFTSYDCLPQKNGKYTRFNQAIVNDIEYYVDRDEYTEEECTEIIYYLNEIISQLNDEYSFSIPEGLSMYIGNKIITQGIYANIYINSHDINSFDGLIAIISGFFGELSNYGLCYGLALYMNNVEMVEADLASYFSKDENLILLDFSIAVFESDYFDEADNLYASSAAYFFTRYIMEQYGTYMLASLIEQSAKLTLDFDILFTEKCNEWLLSISAECKRSEPEAAIRCVKNLERSSIEYKYIFHTRDMQSFIPVGFIEPIMEIELTYIEIKRMLTSCEQDLNIIKQFLSRYIETNLKQICCYYMDDKIEFNYYRLTYIEYRSPYNALIHEYVHYLTNTYISYINSQVWIAEGIAVYMSIYFPNRLYTQNIRTFIENKIYTLIESDNVDNNAEEIKLLNYALLLDDYAVYNDLQACLSYSGVYPLYKFSELQGSGSEGWFMSYQEAGSLINYLVTTYGASTFFTLLKGEVTLNEAYGKDINELYEEWGTYISFMLDDYLNY